MSIVSPTAVPEPQQKRWLILGLTLAVAIVVVVAAQKPVLLLGVALSVPAAWVALVRPDLYTLAVMGLLYTNVAVVAVRFHGAPMAAAIMVPLLLAIPVAHRWVFRRQPIVIDRVFQLLVCFLLAQLIATVFSEDRAVSLRDVFETASEGLVLYLLVFNAVRTTQVLRHVVWVLLLAGAAIGALCFFQHVTKTYDRNYGGFAQIEESPGFRTRATDLQGEVRQRRLSGPIGSQNRLAQVLLMLVPLGMFRFWGERSGPLRAMALFATALVALGLMLTFSRGAAVAFMLMVAVMVVLRYISVRQCLAVVAGACLLLAMLPQYVTRMASLRALLEAAQNEEAGIAAADGSLRSRLAEAMSAVLMFAEHPLTGVGPGMYPYHYQHYAEIVGTEIQGVKVKGELRQPHMLYLGVAAELGLPGLVVFVCLATTVLVRLERARRASLRAGRSDLALLAAGFLLAMVVYLGTGLFLHLSYVRYFWLMTALASAASSVVAGELSALGSIPNGASLWDRSRSHHELCHAGS